MFLSKVVVLEVAVPRHHTQLGLEQQQQQQQQQTPKRNLEDKMQPIQIHGNRSKYNDSKPLSLQPYNPGVPG